jgi:hypothetical protein
MLGLIGEGPLGMGQQVQRAERVPVHEQLQAQHAGHPPFRGPRAEDRPARITARSIVAVGGSILVITLALLSDEQARFIDLAPDYYARRTNPERKVRQHVRDRQALGYCVTLNPTDRMPPPSQDSREAAACWFNRDLRIRRLQKHRPSSGQW